jgi:hypothetical protein
MGLGKTVVSLALILRNPAPIVPMSGSSSSLIGRTVSSQSAGGRVYWDPYLAKKAQKINKKRGSILCRGTLVVASQC